MKFVSNAGSDRVLDLIRPWLKPNHRMDMVSPSFSLYAFFEVLTELPHLSNARLVVPPTSTTPTKGTEQEQLGLLGTAADRASRNKLQAPWLARKLAAWLESKADVRHASGPIPQGTLVLRDALGSAQQAALGSFSFSSEGLGVTNQQPIMRLPRFCIDGFRGGSHLFFMKISMHKAGNWPCFRPAPGTTSSGSCWLHLP